MAEGFKKMLEIRGLALMFRIGKGTKNDKVSLNMINMKEKMVIYLLEVSDIGYKTMLKI